MAAKNPRTEVNDSRRRFLQTVGTGVPSLALLATGEPAKPQDAAGPAAKTPHAEGGDPAYRHLTLQAVATDHREVHYDEIADAYGGPMSRAPVVSVKAHPELVWVRPDMGIGMVANPVAIGVGTAPRLVPWRAVRRSLWNQYLPIVVSRYSDRELQYGHVTYATVLDGGEVKTGHEKQAVMIRMGVTNLSPTDECEATWWAYVPATVATTDGPPYFWSYNLFEVTGSLPPVPQEALSNPDDVVRQGATSLAVYAPGPEVKVTAYDGVLRFQARLLPGQEKYVDLKVSSNKHGFTNDELDRLRKLDFITARDQRVWVLEGILARGTKIAVPEPVVNNIYKAQILYNQTQMVQAADRDYYVPVQGSMGFWPWEQMKQLVALDSYGFHDDVQKSLGYYLKLQGKRPPQEKVKSFAGAIPASGTFEDSGWEGDSDSTIYGVIAKRMAGKEAGFPNWASNTGSSLTAFGEHYFYTRDKQWLQSVAPALVKACDWIINERHATKQMDASGQKVLEYGLMPRGRSTDMDTQGYDLCFTDAYTYQGLQRAAEALADIGHPDGQRLVEEAKGYRRDIEEVMRRTQRTDPEQSPYPVRLNQPDDWTVYATGPIALIDTGLLDPHDPAFPQAENYLLKHVNLGVLGLMGRVPVDDPRVPGSYYMVTGEDLYHYGLVVRGEVEKALLTFYSTLAFGVDKNTLGAIERFSLYDQRYSPFFIDSSGGMRIAGMIRRAVLMEWQQELYLLGGVPRRWLEAGKVIEVRDAAAYFGTFDLTVESRVDKGTIVARIALKKGRPDWLRKIRLRVPHPDRQKMSRVTVNGEPWTSYTAEQEVVEIQPTQAQYEVLVSY